MGAGYGVVTGHPGCIHGILLVDLHVDQGAMSMGAERRKTRDVW